MPHDVFISYSSIDKTAAFAACATFEAAHIRCWIAPRDVAAGAEWAEEIIDAIEAAKIMVLIFSTSSNDSRQVKREIELAVSRGLTIMPIRLDQVEPTRSMAYYMAGVHWIDALTLPLENHFKKMVDWIKPHLADGAAPKQSPPPPPKAEAKPKAPPAATSEARSNTLFDTFFRARPTAAGTAEMPKSETKPKEPARRMFAEGPAPTGVHPAPPPPEHPANIETISIMFRSALALQKQKRHQEAIDAYRKLIDWIDGDARPICVDETVRSYFNVGNSLNDLGRPTEAILEFDTALDRAAGRDDAGVRETVARILFNKAHALDKLGHKTEAVVEYNKLIEIYGEDVDGVGRELSCKAWLMKGIMKGALGDENLAILDYEMLLEFYGDDTGQDATIAEGMFNIGAAPGVKGRGAQAVDAYDQILARFRGATDPVVTEFVAKALYNKGNRLSELKRPAKAIKAYDEVIASFGNDPRMPDRIAKAMLNRANQYGNLGKRKEANAAYQAVIDTFAGHRDASVQQQVANARSWKT